MTNDKKPTLEYLQKKFESHSLEFSKNNGKEDFNIADALSIICEEIISIKEKLK